MIKMLVALDVLVLMIKASVPQETPVALEEIYHYLAVQH